MHVQGSWAVVIDTEKMYWMCSACFWPCTWKIPEQLLSSQRKVWEVLLDALEKRIKHEDWSSTCSLKMRLYESVKVCKIQQSQHVTYLFWIYFTTISWLKISPFASQYVNTHGWRYPPLHHSMWTLMAEDTSLCITVCEHSWLKIAPFASQSVNTHGWRYFPLHHSMWTLMAEDTPLCITVCERSWLKISPLHHSMTVCEHTTLAQGIPFCITVCEHSSNTWNWFWYLISLYVHISLQHSYRHLLKG